VAHELRFEAAGRPHALLLLGWRAHDSREQVAKNELLPLFQRAAAFCQGPNRLEHVLRGVKVLRHGRGVELRRRPPQKSGGRPQGGEAERASHQGIPLVQVGLGEAEIGLGRDVAKESVKTKSVVGPNEPHGLAVRRVAEPPLQAIKLQPAAGAAWRNPASNACGNTGPRTNQSGCSRMVCITSSTKAKTSLASRVFVGTPGTGLPRSFNTSMMPE
jgi:hypothetical protein